MRKITFKLLVCLIVFIAVSGCKKSQVDKAASADDVNSSKKKSTFTVTNNQYYVSAQNGNDATNDGSVNSPYKTINKAVTMVQPGGTVFIKNEGEYTYNPAGVYGAVVTIDSAHSGTPGNYITYKAYTTPPTIHVKASDNIYNAVVINARYIKFQNIIVKGDLDNSSLLPAPASDAAADVAKYNSNGISIGGIDIAGTNTPTFTPSYVTISGCIVHDVPGCGISAIQSDRITFDGNEVYRTSFYSVYGTSGISVLVPYNVAGLGNGSITDPKIIIRNNVCHDNKELIKNKAAGQITDGNGIIVDVNNTYRNGDPGIYNGYTRVENNISYNNGGSGISVTKAHNVSILNNTLYNNTQQLAGYAEIGLFDSSCNNIDINNNIMYAKTGSNCYRASAPVASTIKFDYNVYYNGTANPSDPDARIGNPYFAGPLPAVGTLGVSPTVFKPNSTLSKAKDSGWGATPHYSYYDIANVLRVIDTSTGKYPDCGAYEVY